MVSNWKAALTPRDEKEIISNKVTIFVSSIDFTFAYKDNRRNSWTKGRQFSGFKNKKRVIELRLIVRVISNLYKILTNKAMEGLMDSFSLTIKIGTEKIIFTIVTKESKEQMFEKLKQIHPQCALKKQQTLNKLKFDLQNKLKTHNVKSNLVKTIQYYLANNFSSQQNAKLSRNGEDILTRKQESSLTTRNVSLKVSPNKLKPDASKQQRVEKKEEAKEQEKDKQQAKHKKKGSISSKQKAFSQSHSQPKKQAINQDLVKAYQIIMQKSTQVDMKMMAKKQLQELGRLPQVQRKIQNVITAKMSKGNFEEHIKASQQVKIQQKHEKMYKVVQNNQRSPIEKIYVQSQKRQNNSRLPLSKDFRTNRYNYSENNKLYGTQEYDIEISKLSASGLKKKFNYILDFS